VDQGDAMRIVKGTYCLEAATYDPNPHSWSTGPVAPAPGAGGAVTGPASTPLTSSSRAS
jgi:hypothetical protein